jgi:hypothetical protein
MSLEMSHEDVQAVLASEALGALEPAEREAVLRHASDCPACETELRSLRATADALAWAAPPRPMDAERSDRLRARLVARAAADRGASDDAASAPPAVPVPGSTPTADGTPRGGELPRAAEAEVIEMAPRRAERGARPGRVAGWMAAAAAIALLALGAYTLSLRGRMDEMRRALAATEDAEIAARQAMAARDSTLTALTGARVKVIDLAATGGRAPGGRMFWDPGTHTWRFFAHDLPAVAEGREYQLWLITPGRRISAGTFRPHADGRAHVAATFPLPADSLRAIAVTEEPAGGMPQPTGTPLLVGAMSD